VLLAADATAKHQVYNTQVLFCHHKSCDPCIQQAMLLATRQRAAVEVASNRVNLPVKVPVYELSDDGVAKVHLRRLFRFMLLMCVGSGHVCLHALQAHSS
jgi:hypothetical protein